MKALVLTIAVLFLASPALAARHKTASVVLQAVPGSFVAANPQTAQVLGESNPVAPYYDSSGVPIQQSWVYAEIAESNYQPGYSLHAAAYATPGNPDCTLLQGTPYEVRWRSLSVGYGPALGGGNRADFDDTDIWFAGVWTHYTNSMRDVTVSNQGGFLTVNSTQGGFTCVTVTVPGGDTYEAVGVRP